jgi:hypothetical protein
VPGDPRRDLRPRPHEAQCQLPEVVHNRLANLPGVAMVTTYVTMKTLAAGTT